MPKNQNQSNITTANQNEGEYHTEPMKLQSKNDKITLVQENACVRLALFVQLIGWGDACAAYQNQYNSGLEANVNWKLLCQSNINRM